jgi:predicted 3-demethylubiquinone-9 3-methyltransferase (glyoxalase superfamily)
MSAEFRITPCLWFNFNAEEAVAFYLSVFKTARITSTSHYGDHGPGPAGSVMTIAFEIDGQPFVALNGGPHYHFTPAISLMVKCDDPAESDDYWRRLTEGGKPSRGGWLTDRFGVSWQIPSRGFA